MISFLAALLTVALFGWLVYHFAPAPGERWDRILTRYRPHSPMSDWSSADYEGQRQYSDLAAVHAHREAQAALGEVDSAFGVAGRASQGPVGGARRSAEPRPERTPMRCGGAAVQS